MGRINRSHRVHGRDTMTDREKTLATLQHPSPSATQAPRLHSLNEHRVANKCPDSSIALHSSGCSGCSCFGRTLSLARECQSSLTPYPPACVPPAPTCHSRLTRVLPVGVHGDHIRGRLHGGRRKIAGILVLPCSCCQPRHLGIWGLEGRLGPLRTQG